jgi:hypothetical protein
MTTINDNLFSFENIVCEFTHECTTNQNLIKIFNQSWEPNINHTHNRIIYFIDIPTKEVERLYEINFIYNNFATIKKLCYKNDDTEPSNEDINVISRYFIKSLEINIKNIEIINLIGFKLIVYKNIPFEDKNWILYKKSQWMDIENKKLKNSMNCYVKTIILDTSFNEVKLNMISICKQQTKENQTILTHLSEAKEEKQTPFVFGNSQQTNPPFTNIFNPQQPNTNPQQPNTFTNTFTNPQQPNTNPQQPNTFTNTFTNPQQPNTFTNTFTNPQQPTTNPQQPNSFTNTFTNPQQPNSFTNTFTNPQQPNTFTNPQSNAFNSFINSFTNTQTKGFPTFGQTNSFSNFK